MFLGERHEGSEFAFVQSPYGAFDTLPFRSSVLSLCYSKSTKTVTKAC